MNSHITVPRLIYNEFTGENGYLYKYEIEKNLISKTFPKSTFTKENYYSNLMEKKLSIHVENPLKKLVYYARQLRNDDFYAWNEEMIEIAKIYVKSLFARSPLVCKEAVTKSIFLQFAKKNEQIEHDMVVDNVMSNSCAEKLNRDYDYSFMVNKTQTPFVIPTSGMYGFGINGAKCINVPLTPWCAISMRQKGKIFTGEVQNPIEVVPDGMDDLIMQLNYFAFRSQKRDGIGYVVCGRRDILKTLAQADLQ